jgi:hypothetical protein
MSPNISIELTGIRLDDWVNPFGASPEELLAGTLEEGGLLASETQINGKSAQNLYMAYNKKRRQFQEATRLGTLLVKMGLITQDQLTQALDIQKKTNTPLGEALVSLNFVSAEVIEEILAKQKAIRTEMEQAEQAAAQRKGLWDRLSNLFGPEAK